MLGNLIVFLMLFGLIGLLTWLVRIASTWHSPALKWSFSILLGLLAVLLTVVTGVGLIGLAKTILPVHHPLAQLVVDYSESQVSRGRSLVGYCSICHASRDGSVILNGRDRNLLAIPDGPVIGVMYAPNLTPAGEIKGWTDGEIIRAIREGVDKDNRPLLIMPSEYFKDLSDEDVKSMVAYLRSQPAVPNTLQVDSPSNRLNLIGYLVIGSGLYHTSVQAPITRPVTGPQPGITPEYGNYLTHFAGCRECHGEDFSGGTDGGLHPRGPNLTVLVPEWDSVQFITTIHTGVDPYGHSLNPTVMPWREFSAAFSDEDLKAIYMYLRSLPATLAKTK